MEHLRKVINKLARFGYPHSVSGRGADVALGSTSGKIRIGDLIVAIEENLSIFSCEVRICKLTGGYSLEHTLNHTSDAFIDSLNWTLLGDLLGQRQMKRRFRSINISSQPVRVATCRRQKHATATCCHRVFEETLNGKNRK